MSEAKFTTVEWRVEPCIVGGGMLIRGDGTRGSHPQGHLQIVPLADAYLIGAVKDLYAACEAIVHATTMRDSALGAVAATLASAALAKARGEVQR